MREQVLAGTPDARLLLCAPQNYSADLLASALGAAGVPKQDLLRLNDPRRPPNQVHVARHPRSAVPLSSRYPIEPFRLTNCADGI